MASRQLNALAKGFYTVPEAVRLLEGGSGARVYGWLKGYHKSGLGPLLSRDYQPIDDRQELSFVDLIEIRFVEHFRSHGVKAKTLRIASEELRREYATDHPFATDRVHLVADKADIFREVMKESAERERDRVLISLTNKNLVMEEMIRRYLVPGISFNTADHLPIEWIPRPTQFPHIKVDPKVAYGQPFGPSLVPTRVLFDAYVAEGENVDEAAYWFEVSSHEVAQAVEFERLLGIRQAKAA